MQLDKISDKRLQETFVKREVDIVQKVKHPNVAEIYDVFKIGESIVLVGHLYECDLLQYVQQRGSIIERVARRLLLELVSAVKYIHDINIGKFANWSQKSKLRLKIRKIDLFVKNRNFHQK